MKSPPRWRLASVLAFTAGAAMQRMKRRKVAFIEGVSPGPFGGVGQNRKLKHFRYAAERFSANMRLGQQRRDRRDRADGFERAARRRRCSALLKKAADDPVSLCFAGT